MLTNLVINKHFICFAATSNVLTVYCETHKILLICMTSKSAQLTELNKNKKDQF